MGNRRPPVRSDTSEQAIWIMLLIIALLKRTLLLLTVTGIVFLAGAGADDIQLPDMGSPADAILSKTTEAQIGRAIMRSIRQSGQIVEDPQILSLIHI